MLRPLLIVAAAALLAGCGSHGRTVTVQGYGDHPATTIAAGSANPQRCRLDAVSFADAARDFLAHSGPKAAYPADLWLVLLRESLGDFQAHSCDPAVLGATLRSRLSAAQIERFVNDLPRSLAIAVRAGL